MAWNPGEGWLRLTLINKGEKLRNRIKNRKVKFMMKLKRLNMQNKLNPPYGMPTEFFASNGRQEVYDGYLEFF